MKKMLDKYLMYTRKILSNNSNILKHIALMWGGMVDFMIFGSTVTDYFELAFYKKKHYEKKGYMTWRDSRKFSYIVDTQEKMSFYIDKKNMYTKLSNWLFREQLFCLDCTYEDFMTFIDNTNGEFIYKPAYENSGRGIELVKCKSQDTRKLYNSLVNRDGILEGIIKQHETLDKICSCSVNTVRIFTLKINSSINFIGACLRIGNGNSIVDNYSNGGYVAAINIDSGKVIDGIENMYGERIYEHPYSGFSMNGFVVPKWEEVLLFVNKMAINFDLNYVAWDIAIRENDCVLVEANPRGMVNTIQVAGNGGKKEKYKDLLKLYNK